jgi:hypothetical protein
MAIAYQEHSRTAFWLPYVSTYESLRGGVGEQLNEYVEVVRRQIYTEYWPLGPSSTVRPIGAVLSAEIATALLRIDASVDRLSIVSPGRRNPEIEALADDALSALAARHTVGLGDDWSDVLADDVANADD